MLQLARPEDREAIDQIARQIHALHVDWRPDIFKMPQQMYSIERFSDAVSHRQLYAAKVGEQVLGYVLLKVRDYDWPGVVNRKVMIVDEFGVAEGLRGQGIGTQMMDDVKVLARAFGCTDLQLGVYPQNDDAIAFYQRCGLMIRSIEMQMKL